MFFLCKKKETSEKKSGQHLKTKNNPMGKDPDKTDEPTKKRKNEDPENDDEPAKKPKTKSH